MNRPRFVYGPGSEVMLQALDQAEKDGAFKGPMLGNDPYWVARQPVATFCRLLREERRRPFVETEPAPKVTP